MMQWVRWLPAMPESHVNTPVPVQAAPFLIQLPSNGLRKAAQDGPHALAMTPT